MINLTTLRDQFSQSPTRKRALLGLASLGMLLVTVLIVRGFSNSQAAPLLHHNVQRGDFLVSIVEGGALRALNEVLVRSQVDGTARIISIVPEGTYVKKGDLLVELDTSDLRDRLTQQEISFQSSLAAFIQARENLSIQHSQQESNIKEAELKVEFADSDLKKFIEGERAQRIENAKNKITIIDEELKRADDRLAWSKVLQEKGYATKTELEADGLKVTVKNIELSQAQLDLKLLEEYDLKRTQRQLESNHQQAIEELKRTHQRALSQIAQSEADLKSRQATHDLSEFKLNQIKEQLEHSKIYAPQDGLVVYATQSSSYGSSSSGPIEEGASIRQRQEIIKLPDISQMLVEIKVHESHVNLVRPGLPAWVTVDSMPDQRYRGVVRRVALLPDSQSRYSNPNLKVYATEVLIEDELPDLKPGISARAEIVITNLRDVLTVPIQSVHTVQGHQVTYVNRGGSIATIPVEVGLYDDKFIEVRSGLQEGDRVLLAPPTDRSDSNLDNSLLAASKKDERTLPEPTLAEVAPRSSLPAAEGAPPHATAEGSNSDRPPRDPAARPDSQKMRESMQNLSPEEREARTKAFREKRGPGGGPPGSGPARGGEGRGDAPQGGSER